MQDFRQLCPSCKQTLELPLSASGKRAQCPACEMTFTAGEHPYRTTDFPITSDQNSDENVSVDSETKDTAQEIPLKPAEPHEPSEPHKTVESRPNLIDLGLANPINKSAPDDPNNSLPLPTAERAEVSDINVPSQLETPQKDTSQPETAQTLVTDTENSDSSQLYSLSSNPFSQPLLEKSVATEPFSHFVNSNEISHKHVGARAKVIIVPCSTAELFKTTWAIMLDRGLTLIASLLFLVSMIAVVLVIGSVAYWILNLLISDSAMVIISSVTLMLLSTLVTISLCRNAISIIRNTSDLMADSVFTFRSIVNTLIPASLILAVASFYKWLLLTSYSIDLTVTVLVGLCTIGTLGWLWVSIFLCADSQCSGLKSLVMAVRISYHNKLSTLALISVSTVLMLMGIASKGILLIVAVPFIQLLLATSYLMMTNQPFANPRYQIATDETI
ncbi:MAG: hypothetical protein ACPHF4_07435 [Rubripirellula sp.]